MNPRNLQYKIYISGQDNIIGGPSIGKRCQFPFEYKGIMHYKCTTEDSLGQPWCASSSNYSIHTFGYCDCPFTGIYIFTFEVGLKCLELFYIDITTVNLYLTYSIVSNHKIGTRKNVGYVNPTPIILLQTIPTLLVFMPLNWNAYKTLTVHM